MRDPWNSRPNLFRDVVLTCWGLESSISFTYAHLTHYIVFPSFPQELTVPLFCESFILPWIAQYLYLINM